MTLPMQTRPASPQHDIAAATVLLDKHASCLHAAHIQESNSLPKKLLKSCCAPAASCCLVLLMLSPGFHRGVVLLHDTQGRRTAVLQIMDTA